MALVREPCFKKSNASAPLFSNPLSNNFLVALEPTIGKATLSKALMLSITPRVIVPPKTSLVFLPVALAATLANPTTGAFNIAGANPAK